MSKASSSVLVVRLNKDIVAAGDWVVGGGKGLKLTRIIGELCCISEWIDWQKMFLGFV